MKNSRIFSYFNKVLSIGEKYPLIFPLVLLLFALVTYAVFITSLGFYWDDWPPILLSHVSDLSLNWDYWSYDRPLQSWTYYLLFPICGDSTLLWQLSAIFARWTSALTLYYTFLLVFPRQKSLLQWSAVLFVVFPGFTDQYASVSYGSHFMVYTVFGLSLLFMALAFKKPARFWIFYPLSLIFAAFHLFTMEYFVGLELMRPVLMYWLMVDDGMKRLKAASKALLHWLPYLLVLGVYLYWRMVVFPNSETGAPSSNYPYLISNFLKAPADTLVGFVQTLYSDLRFLLLTIWTDRLIPASVEIKSVTLWLSLVIGLGAAFVLHFFFAKPDEGDGLIHKARDVWRNVILFAMMFFFGIFPIWSTLRQITKGKWSDRFDIPAMFGVAILLVTLLCLLVPKTKTRNLVLVLLVGLSISFQIQVGNDYRKDFINQKAFYSQLAWRIPYLAPGTTVYSPGIPTDKEADYSYSMGINLLYTSQAVEPDLKYWFSGPRYHAPEDLLADPGMEIKDGLRIFNFSGKAEKMVSVLAQSGTCLLVLDPYYGLLPDINNKLPLYGELTNWDMIGETALEGSLLADMIDISPQNTWCYYFQKADLAQSQGRMEEVVGFYEQAMAHNLKPLEAVEYLPFIKAYAALGEIEQALDLTKKAFAKSGSAKPPLCQLWKDILRENPTIPLSNVDSVYNSGNCSMIEP